MISLLNYPSGFIVVNFSIPGDQYVLIDFLFSYVYMYNCFSFFFGYNSSGFYGICTCMMARPDEVLSKCLFVCVIEVVRIILFRFCLFFFF